MFVKSGAVVNVIIEVDQAVCVEQFDQCAQVRLAPLTLSVDLSVDLALRHPLPSLSISGARPLARLLLHALLSRSPSSHALRPLSLPVNFST
eukprot:2570536-Pleurochrysis_carterae.AAC.2